MPVLRLRVPLVLASRSPRRRRLLEQLGLDFELAPSGADERVEGYVPPPYLVEQLARRKAETVAEQHPNALVLGADTVVVHEGDVLGQPADEAEAAETLRRLSGHRHVVYTGIALIHLASERCTCAHETTRVRFGELSDEEIRRYVEGGSPMDKAGAYGIQDDHGALFVHGIEGDYYNVVGLPLRRLYVTLRDHFDDLLEGGDD